MRCHSVFSVRSPELRSRKLKLVAIWKLATVVSLAVWRISGAAPTLPSSSTMFFDFMSVSNRE